MSAVTILLLVGGWLVFVVAILSILAAAKRADEAAERAHARSVEERRALRFTEHDRRFLRGLGARAARELEQVPRRGPPAER